MDFENMLKNRERETEDQIIYKEYIINTNEFTGLIEKSIISNIKSTTLFLLKLQFENIGINDVIKKVKQHIPIGDDYRLTESNQYITIHYDFKTRKGCY
jgi:hypothetical protein